MKKILTITILLVVAIVIGTYKPKEKAVIVEPQVQTLCYTRSSDGSEPYQVKEYIKLTINGTSVTGIKKGTQVGPDMQNGYEGIIEGTKNGNIISSIYSYTIEGSNQKEEERYELSESAIIKYRYPLIDNNNILVPDRNKVVELQKYESISCEEFDNNLNNQMI